jgi:hypothetical protein
LRVLHEGGLRFFAAEAIVLPPICPLMEQSVCMSLPSATNDQGLNLRIVSERSAPQRSAD